MSYKHYGPRTRKGRGWLLGICIFLLVLILACGAVFLRARSSVLPDRVMPGVQVWGEEAAGLDREQVRSMLRSGGYDALAGKTFTLVLPGEELTLPLEELGLVPDIEAETDTILAWGHTGDRNRDALDRLLGRTGTPEPFPRQPELTLNEAPLQALCDKAALDLDRDPVRPVVFADEKGLEVTLGIPGARVDKAALLETMRAALERGEYTAEYSPEVIPAETLELEGFWEAYHTEPVDAVFDDTYQVKPEQPGQTFDLAAAEKRLASAKAGEKLHFPRIVLQPEVTAEMLEGLLFRDMLAAIDTPLTDNAVRTKNIEIAASMLDDTILLPGQIFSYNGALGERTEEKGYGPATAYSGGELVEEIGGGICQLSSALYYCAMLADEVILERTNHRYYQTYVPYGMDATVSWGGPDFRFRLKDEYPIRILARIVGDQLRVELWGTKTDEVRVELEYTVDAVYPHGVVYYEHKRVKSGKRVITDYGRDGMQVTTYRVYYDAEGNLLEKVQEAVNVYASRDEVIVVAPGERPKQ